MWHTLRVPEVDVDDDELLLTKRMRCFKIFEPMVYRLKCAVSFVNFIKTLTLMVDKLESLIMVKVKASYRTISSISYY